MCRGSSLNGQKYAALENQPFIFHLKLAKLKEIETIIHTTNKAVDLNRYTKNPYFKSKTSLAVK